MFDLIGGANGSEVRSDPKPVGGFDFGAVSPAASLNGGDGGGSGGSGGNGSSDGNLRDSTGELFDAELHSGTDKRNANGTWRRKRGRKSGGGSSVGRASAKGSASVGSIEKSLIGIHAILAASTGFEDLRLAEPDESRPLAEAIHECSKHFDIPVVDPKYLAVFGLVVTMGRVYAPKVALVKMQIDEKKAERMGRGEVLKFKPRAVITPDANEAPISPVGIKQEPFTPDILNNYMEGDI